MNAGRTVRCVRLRGYGGPDVMYLDECPLPEPGAGEVLVRVHTAGVNRGDLHQRAGTYPPPPDASPILGLEVSGRVAAIGAGADGWKLGDAVCALVPGGGYADFVLTPAPQCLPVPAGLTLEQAAALPEAVYTVWINVFELGRLRPGESLLVHGGSSGIGTMAIQVASALGSRVLTTAGDARKCAFCRSIGADVAINYRMDDFVEAVLGATNGAGVDVVLDMVGGDYTDRNIRALATEGRLVQISTLKGNRVEISLSEVMRRRATITGSYLRPRTIEAKGRVAEEVRRTVWPLLESKRISPIIDRVFPLERVADAHRHLEAGGHIGKVLLAVEPREA
jgi:putative PIG3 family NAD(P)H quinone oxidoreductase